MSNQVIVVTFVSVIEPLFETIFEFTGFGPEAKLLAREYYSLTGKPVGLQEKLLSTKRSEFLGVELMPGRQARYESIGGLRWQELGTNRRLKLNADYVEILKPILHQH